MTFLRCFSALKTGSKPGGTKTANKSLPKALHEGPRGSLEPEKGPSRVPQGTPAGSPKAAKIDFFRRPGAQVILKGPRGHSRDSRKPKIDPNHQTSEQKLTKSMQKPLPQQCKLTFTNVVEMHLELQCYILCKRTFKGSVTATGWAKRTRMSSH